MSTPNEQAPTDAEIAEWQALASEAIPGPWRLTGTGKIYATIPGTDDTDGVVCTADDYGDFLCRGVDGRMIDATEAFIACARTAVPRLCEEVRRLRARDAIVADRDNDPFDGWDLSKDPWSEDGAKIGRCIAEIRRLRGVLLIREGQLDEVREELAEATTALDSVWDATATEDQQ